MGPFGLGICQWCGQVDVAGASAAFAAGTAAAAMAVATGRGLVSRTIGLRADGRVAGIVRPRIGMAAGLLCDGCGTGDVDAGVGALTPLAFVADRASATAAARTALLAGRRAAELRGFDAVELSGFDVVATGRLARAGPAVPAVRRVVFAGLPTMDFGWRAVPDARDLGPALDALVA